MMSRNYEDYQYITSSVFMHICKATVKCNYHVCHVCLSTLNDLAVIGQIFKNFNSYINSSRMSYIGIFTKTCQLVKFNENQKSNTIGTTYICILPFTRQVQESQRSHRNWYDLNIKIHNISCEKHECHEHNKPTMKSSLFNCNAVFFKT
jgi:hypothetical protein